MKSRRPKVPLHHVITAIAVAATGVLLLVKAAENLQWAKSRVGITFQLDENDGTIYLSEVVADGPGDRGGLRVGDRVLEIDGTSITTFDDIDAGTADWGPGYQSQIRVDREGRVLTLRVYPGMTPDWFPYLVNVAVSILSLAVGVLCLSQKPDHTQARLLSALLYLIAIEFAFPQGLTHPTWSLVSGALYYILTGGQIAVELHLASVIPRRHDWLERHPRIVSVYYLAALGYGVVFCAAFLVRISGTGASWPGLWAAMDRVESAVLPLWAVSVVTLLSLAVLRCPDRQGKLQVSLVLLGDLPWAAYAVAGPILLALGVEYPIWLDSLGPGLTVFYPIAVFTAIFRYHLFDLEVVVRRSLIYAFLTSTLVLVFYAALGAGGAAFALLVEGEKASIWVISGATLTLGLLFGPLRRILQQTIDRQFFPEREAVRKRLVDLASELPALGRLPLMGQHLVQRMRRIFAARSAAVLLADPKAKVLLGLASSGSELGEGRSLLLSPDDPAVLHLARTGKPTRAAELTATSTALRQRLEPLGTEIVVPLLSETQLIGLLLLGHKEEERDFSAEELELLSLLAHHVATVFENVRLFQSATYESLTGQLRREAILEVLGKEIERARRYERPLAIAIADIDHFKKVNDRYGHLGGDGVLRRVAEELAASIRSSDAIGRYGGEEFLLVFPETDLIGAAVLSEKLRRRIELLSVPMEDGSVVEVRISIGVAHLISVQVEPGVPLAGDGGGGSTRSPRSSVDDLSIRLISAADRELYRAKKAGRNRVEPVVREAQTVDG